jgi:hypothetical protein
MTQVQAIIARTEDTSGIAYSRTNEERLRSVLLGARKVAANLKQEGWKTVLDESDSLARRLIAHDEQVAKDPPKW